MTLQRYVEGYRRFFLEESETGRVHKGDLLDSLAKVSAGVYFAPAYELERYLVRVLLEEKPKRYTLHRRVETADAVLQDTHHVPVFIGELKKPPKQRDHTEIPHDEYDKQVKTILQSDIAELIKGCQAEGWLVKSTGFGFINAPYKLCGITKFPHVVEESLLHNKRKKSQICELFEEEGISYLGLARMGDNRVCTRRFSLQDFVDESIEKLARGKYESVCSYRFDVIGVELLGRE